LKFPSIIIILGVIQCSSCSKNDNGNSASPPNASFIYLNSSQFAPDSVQFTNTSTNSSSWEWNFGDLGTSVFQNPLHIFYNGTFTVTLKATGPGGVSYAQGTLTIQAPPQTMTIDSIKVTNFPATKPNGDHWDSTSGPDIYIEINKGDPLINEIYKSAVYQDAIPGQTYFFNNVNTTLDKYSNYTISLRDSDGSGTDDDFLWGFALAPAIYTTYPSKIKFTYTNVAFELDVSWE